jgi:CHASE1-domain containing sensor protein
MSRIENAVFGTILAIVSVLLTIALIGLVQSLRAEPAEIACRQQSMDHVRRWFSTEVHCVPNPVVPIRPENW